MNYDAVRSAIKQCVPEATSSRLDWIMQCIQKETPPAKTPAEARDALVTTIHEHPEATRIFDTADKLLALVTKPGMLLAFTLANAELAALHAENQLLVPEIVADKQLVLL